jgi:hypothetical protein
MQGLGKRDPDAAGPSYSAGLPVVFANFSFLQPSRLLTGRPSYAPACTSDGLDVHTLPGLPSSTIGKCQSA